MTRIKSDTSTGEASSTTGEASSSTVEQASSIQLVDQKGHNWAGKEEIVIAIMGITGAGKSYLTRETTSEAVVVGDGLEACTQKVKGVTMQYKGRNVTLLDSPGFNDTYKSDTDVLYLISDYLVETYSLGLKLSGIIYLHPITNIRMDGPSRRSLNMFRKLVGDDALHNVILATTHWGHVSPGIGNRRETELGAKFWKDLTDKGARMTRYNGDQESGFKLLDMLIEKDRIVLDIQREIFDEKQALIDTGAGQVLNEELLNIRRQYGEELKIAKQDLEAISDKDEQSKKEITQEIEQLEAKVDVAEQESHRLKEKNFETDRDLRDLINKLQLLQLATRKREEALNNKQVELTTEMNRKQEELKKEIDALRLELVSAHAAPSSSLWADALPYVATISESAVRAFISYLNR